MKRYFVYIVECADGYYYTGITNNVERRLSEHNNGLDSSSYTYSRRPVILVFQYAFNNPKQAIAFEKQVKGWSRKKKEAIINNRWELLVELSKSKRTSTD